MSIGGDGPPAALLSSACSKIGVGLYPQIDVGPLSGSLEIPIYDHPIKPRSPFNRPFGEETIALMQPSRQPRLDRQISSDLAGWRTGPSLKAANPVAVGTATASFLVPEAIGVSICENDASLQNVETWRNRQPARADIGLCSSLFSRARTKFTTSRSTQASSASRVGSWLLAGTSWICPP